MDLYVRTTTADSNEVMLDASSRYLALWFVVSLSRLALYAKVIGQSSRSKEDFVLFQLNVTRSEKEKTGLVGDTLYT